MSVYWRQGKRIQLLDNIDLPQEIGKIKLFLTIGDKIRLKKLFLRIFERRQPTLYRLLNKKLKYKFENLPAYFDQFKGQPKMEVKVTGLYKRKKIFRCICRESSTGKWLGVKASL